MPKKKKRSKPHWLQVRLDERTHDVFTRHATDSELGKSEIVRRLIRKYLSGLNLLPAGSGE